MQNFEQSLQTDLPEILYPDETTRVTVAGDLARRWEEAQFGDKIFMDGNSLAMRG
jgi:hypothetical protein